MSIERLIEVLDRAGVSVDANTILDALWLATHGPTMDAATLGAPRPSAPGGTTDLPVLTDGQSKDRSARGDDAREETSTSSPTTATPTSHSADPGTVAAYPNADRLGTGRRASTFPTITARVHFDSLPFVRALRPFRERIASAQGLVVDEEATAERSAELSAGGALRIYPVTVPYFERWFEVDLVTEDDAAAEVWRDQLRAFAQTMRNSGAFRDVREWKLDLGRSSTAPAKLRAPSGAVLAATTLAATGRRLILFASHGSSKHWRTGGYARLLTQWGDRCPVALLHLLPADKWGRTTLGEPIGLGKTYRAGVHNAELGFEPSSWLPATATLAALPFPLVELSADAVSEWSAMLMARGRPAPATLLHPRASAALLGDERQEDEGMIARRVGALLSTNPRAFQLGVLLSSAAFTVPVARLIQESYFGRSDHDDLVQLFISGLLRLQPDQSASAVSPWFVIHASAAAILKRSLKASDAESVAQAVVRKVSDHIASATGQRPSMTSFALDEAGDYALPDWAREFAFVAARMVVAPQATPTANSGSEAMTSLESLNPRILTMLARIGAANGRVEAAAMPGDAWTVLLDRRLTEIDPNGDRRFTPPAQGFLTRIDRTQPLLGARILWVDDRPANNAEVIEVVEREGATVVEALSTDAALEQIHAGFDIVISDMARDEGALEGLVLLDELRARQIETPVIIFAAVFATTREARETAARKGAYFTTNDGDALLRHVRRLYRQPGEAADEVFEDQHDGTIDYVSALKLNGYGVRSLESFEPSEIDDPNSPVFLIGSRLIEFSDVAGEARRLAIGQLLLADLAANVQPADAEQHSGDRFAQVMASLGWAVRSSAQEEFPSMVEGEALERVVTMLGPASGAILPTIIAGLIGERGRVPGDSAWLKIYEERVTAYHIGEFRVGFVETDDHVLRCSTSVLRAQGETHRQAVLFFRLNMRKMTFAVETKIFEMPIAALAQLSSAVEAKVAPLLHGNVSAVTFPAP